ncbi:MAG: sporulation protein YqfD [Oscillospiraceae bacterium]|nr:sporulation protein YqfD [Oscillospiraceae bacterium]
MKISKSGSRKSYVEFSAFGVYCNDFVDFLVSSPHQVFDITSSSDIYSIKTSPHNYAWIKRKAGEFGVRTKVIDRRGGYFVLRRYRKRIGLLFGMLAFLGIIVAMSNYIWDIEITGNSQIGNYRIMEQLNKSGIRTGIGINSFNANQVELELAISIPDLAWVSIERSGSRINVKISEQILDDEQPEISLKQPANVISTKSGILVRADVYRGDLLYEVGSGIRAGDVVVSGVIARGGTPENPETLQIPENTENLEPGVTYHYVHADATLIVETSEIVDFYQPFTVNHRIANGRSVNERSFIFLGRRIRGLSNDRNSSQINKNANHIDYFENITTPKFLGFPLPFRVLEQQYTFHERIEVTDSPTAARDNLLKQIELYEQNFILSGDMAEIVERQIEFFPDEEGVGALVRFVFRVNAASQREILV